MKKTLFLTLFLVIILTNINVFAFAFQIQQLSFLHSRPAVAIEYSQYLEEEYVDIWVALKSFSDKYNVNIMQYVYLNDKELNIYATDITYDSSIVMTAGEKPASDCYISNKKDFTSKTRQIGTFSFPLSNQTLHIYDFEQIRNMGLGDTFYFSDTDPTTITAFKKEFSVYGKLVDASVSYNKFPFLDRTLAIINFCSILGFGFVVGLVFVEKRKELIIKSLWGYTARRIETLLLSVFCRYGCVILTIMFSLLFAFCTLFNQMNYFKLYVLIFALANFILSVVLVIIIILVGGFILRMNGCLPGTKEKLPYKQIALVSAFLKGIVCLIVFSAIASSIGHYYQLKQKTDDFEFWDKTKNTYRIIVGYIPNSKMVDMEFERALNNRSLDFYRELVTQKNAFLMNSKWFTVISYDEGKPVYIYTKNYPDSKNFLDDESRYSPYGRCVVINKNYLKENLIESSNGCSILDQMKNEEDTLDILVPEQYKKFESKIVESFLEYFYFKKVEVDNIYNKELQLPINKKNMKDLKINPIYVKTGQSYFTFNCHTGDDNNMIKDPIAILYNESVDTSETFANLTSSVYYKDVSSSRAYENITNILRNTDMREIRTVRSVYSEANDVIIKLRNLLYRQMIELFFSIIGSTVLLSMFIWAYHHLYLRNVTIKYIMGYSFCRRNRHLIIVTLSTNIIAGVCALFLFHVKVILIFVLIITLIDMYVTYVLGNRFCRNNVNKIIKGDFI